MFLLISFEVIAQGTDNKGKKIRPLEQFVGYYDVGVRPNEPFFKSRWYLRDGKLFAIYDSDYDRIFEPYENGKPRANVSFKEEDLQITDTDSTIT